MHRVLGGWQNYSTHKDSRNKYDYPATWGDRKKKEKEEEEREELPVK
jgi:hypothetical protein